MPVLRLTDHRIAKGWITVTALLAGSYRALDLTVVSDQIIDNQTVYPWAPPMNPNQTPSYSNRDRTLTGQLKQYGAQQFQWKFQVWTFGMVSTWQSTFYDDVNQSNKVTIGTYNAQNVAQYLQCYMDPVVLPGPSGDAVLGGFQNVVTEFWGGTTIT
jgi:hypothetical protein